jgi:hypothetical protein
MSYLKKPSETAAWLDFRGQKALHAADSRDSPSVNASCPTESPHPTVCEVIGAFSGLEIEPYGQKPRQFWPMQLPLSYLLWSDELVELVRTISGFHWRKHAV